MVLSPRHELITDAALQVLAQSGAHGLTHRAVDAAADLPTGSTSYYFRTRAALLAGCVQRLLEQDQQELDALEPLVTAADLDELAAALGDLLKHWLTAARARQLARYELTLSAVRHPDLSVELLRAGAALRDRMSATLRICGASEPDRQARLLVACVDGLLFDRIVGFSASRTPDEEELRLAARDLLRCVLVPTLGRLSPSVAGPAAAAPRSSPPPPAPGPRPVPRRTAASADPAG